MVVASVPTITNTDFDEESVNYENLLGILKEYYDKDSADKPFLISDEGVKIIL